MFNFLLYGLEQSSQVKGTIFLSLFNILMFIHKHVCVCVYMCVYTHILLCHRVCEVREQHAETSSLLLCGSWDGCQVPGLQHRRSESTPPSLGYLDSLLNSQYPDSFPALVWQDPGLWCPHTPDVFPCFPHLHGFPHHPWTRVLSPHFCLSSLISHGLWNNPQFPSPLSLWNLISLILCHIHPWR